MPIDLLHLKNAYHKIIKYEYQKYKKTSKLKDTFFTKEEIVNKDSGITEETFQKLLDEGFIIKVDNNKFHSLLMDLAYRIADIRVMYGGTKYVLEYSLDLKERPMLNTNYVRFDIRDSKLDELIKEFAKIIPASLVEKFIEALKESGLRGLSRYQYESILSLLRKDKDAVICAPTAFGKTYVFLIPVLLYAIKNALENRRGVFAVLFYPRKSLGSDQMGRLIRLVRNINAKLGSNITIGIDDGDVKSKNDFSVNEEYRGIRCPSHPKEKLKIVRQGKDWKVFCKECGKPFDFIILSRDDLLQNPPNILITNIWAFQHKLCNTNYWKSPYLSENIGFFVFDEIHAYRGVVAGSLRYLTRILRSLVSSRARLIFSSATIPQIEQFISDITGLENDGFLKLIYNEQVHGKDESKLELYLLVAIHPLVSWETYTHELAIFLSTVNRIRMKKNVQSLIFVDSIRNISRLYSQMQEAIKLGDPEDHLKKEISPEEPFCYWIYNEKYKNIDNDELEKLREDILAHIETHYSDKSDRFDIEEKIKNADLDVVFTTSTLELGVDYDNVMVVANTGIPFSLESIIQRVGRAGRNVEKTLHTSLSIVIVRNNPLEYFYIYKGVGEITDVNKLPKIPVSYTNIFVVFYSALLYAIAYHAKKGESLRLPREKVVIGDVLREILSKLDEVQPNLVKDFGIRIEDIDSWKSKLWRIADILSKPNFEATYQALRASLEKQWIFNEISEYAEELDKMLSMIKEKLREVNENEKRLILNYIENIHQSIDSLKSIDVSRIRDAIDHISKGLDEIINSIPDPWHPLYEFYNELLDLRDRLQRDLKMELAKIKEGMSIQQMSPEEFNLYYKAKEIYESPSDTPIGLLESIVGFKFMGLEFIDQQVKVYSEYSTSEKDKKDESLTNVVSRTPPFEMITIPFENTQQKSITDIVGARHFWLVKPARGIKLDPYNSEYFKMIRDYHLTGESKHYKDIAIPLEIKYIDALSLSKPITVEFTCEDGKKLYIKYGSNRLAKEKINQRYPLPENIRKLYDPSIENLEKIKKATIQHLRELDRDVREEEINSWGLNLRYPAICLLGYCISTDPYDTFCPIGEKGKCGIGECKGIKYWSASRGHRRIFPKFFARLNVRNCPPTGEPIIYDIGTKTFDELKEDIEFVYDNVTVQLPVWASDYMLRKIKIAPIGYLARTSFVYLTLNEKFIDFAIPVLLEQDEELTNILKFKYFMFKKLKEKQSQIDAAKSYSKYNAEDIDVDSKDFKDFIKESLLHSLAHLFLIYILKEVQLEPDRVTYHIANNTIYIIENSKNDGIGLVETVRERIRKEGVNRFMEDFVKSALEFLEEHTKRVNERMRALSEEARSYLEHLKGENIIKELSRIREEIKRINNDIRPHINPEYLDVITYRHILAGRLSKESKLLNEGVSEYILPIIYSEGIPKMCADGCEECLILSRGCSDPFSQNYVISKRLIHSFLNLFRRKNISILSNNCGYILEDMMKKSKVIIVHVPYIDEHGVKLLCECSSRGTRVEVFTRDDNPDVVKSLQSCGVDVKFSKGHAKLYLLEADGRKVCIHGSVNLTNHSLHNNRENMTITFDDVDICRNLLNMDEPR